MSVSEAVERLEQDLRGIFGHRLQSLVTYAGTGSARAGAPISSLAVVDSLTPDDLRACATRTPEWHLQNLGTPLLLPADELARSLDAFPLEFSAILDRYRLIAGRDPFADLQIDPMHLRMACEVQARSHLLHLREDYLETEGRGSEVAALLAESAPALASLVTSVARLEGASGAGPDEAARYLEQRLGLGSGSLADIVALVDNRPFSAEEARRKWPLHMDGIERLTRHVDGWGER